MISINSHEPKEIIDILSRNVKTEIKNFTPGDYIIDYMGVERKTISDFCQSMIEKRLFEQLKRLSDCYLRNFLVIEDFDLDYFKSTKRIYGAILKIILELGVNVIVSKSKEHTAEILLMLHKRTNNYFADNELIFKPKFRSLKDRQLFLIQGIANIGNVKAKRLLANFGTMRNIFNSSEDKLLKIKGIGKKTFKNIKDVLDNEY